MKKWILAAVVVLAAMPVMAQYEEKFPSYIQVNGRADKEITPDEFYVGIVIAERDSKGKISVEQQQREMTSTLRGLGINVEKQLTVADMSSEFYRRKSSVATARYQLLLHSAADVARVYAALDKLGISNVDLQRVSHTQIKQYKDQVRAEAMQNAQKTAAELAQAVGQQLGACFYIYDSNSDVVPYYYNNISTMRAKAADLNAESAAEEPLEFKTIKLSYNVQTKFILLQ